MCNIGNSLGPQIIHVQDHCTQNEFIPGSLFAARVLYGPPRSWCTPHYGAPRCACDHTLYTMPGLPYVHMPCNCTSCALVQIRPKMGEKSYFHPKCFGYCQMAAPPPKHLTRCSPNLVATAAAMVCAGAETPLKPHCPSSKKTPLLHLSNYHRNPQVPCKHFPHQLLRIWRRGVVRLTDP